MPEPGENADACQAARKRVPGLPKEPRTDRDLPFKELAIGTQRPGS